MKDLSESLVVRSILGRFLEHSRIFEFENAGDPQIWIGSADMMHRNLDRRVEALVRIDAPEHVAYLRRLMDLGFDDSIASWHLQPDGDWVRVNTDEEGNR